MSTEIRKVRTRAGGEAPYAIDERAFVFAARVIRFVQSLPRNMVTYTLSQQLLRSATAVGANIEEADGTTTAADRSYRRSVARREAREARYWLRLIRATAIDLPEGRALEQESEELARILSTLISRHIPPPSA